MNERIQKRVQKDRPMTTISIRIPEDVIDDLRLLAPVLGFSGYQPLLRAYIGQGLRKDLAKLENDRVKLVVQPPPPRSGRPSHRGRHREGQGQDGLTSHDRTRHRPAVVFPAGHTSRQRHRVRRERSDLGAHQPASPARQRLPHALNVTRAGGGE